MRSKVALRYKSKMPEEVKIFTDKYAALIVLTNQLLKEKSNSETKGSSIFKEVIDSNLTLRSIAKLEAMLGESLLNVSSRKPTYKFIMGPSKSLSITVKNNKQQLNYSNWKYSMNYKIL